MYQSGGARVVCISLHTTYWGKERVGVRLHTAYPGGQGWCASVCIQQTLGARVVCVSLHTLHPGGKVGVCQSAYITPWG